MNNTNNNIRIESITESKIKKSKSVSELDQFGGVLRGRIENGNKYWIWFITIFLILVTLTISTSLVVLGLFINQFPDNSGSQNSKMVSIILSFVMALFFLVLGSTAVYKTLKLSLSDNKLLSKRKSLKRIVEKRKKELNNKIILELGSLSYTTKQFLKEKGVM